MDKIKNRAEYIQSLFARETPALTRIRESLTHVNDQISIYPEEGKLLQLLIQLIGAKTVVEIGTLGGYACAWMADALPHDGKIITIERDPRRYEFAYNNLKDNPKIETILGNAHDILPTLTGPFDMVFIDADKLSYLDYLDWAEKNIRSGGLIIGDNTFLFDAVWMENELPDRIRASTRDIMKTFNERLSNPDQYNSIMIPTVEGMTIAQKK